MTDSLIGRSFVSRSNNVAKIQRIGDNAIRAFWSAKPSSADVEEFNKFVEGCLGDINLTVNVGKGTEASAYSHWLKKQSEGF